MKLLATISESNMSLNLLFQWMVGKRNQKLDVIDEKKAKFDWRSWNAASSEFEITIQNFKH